MSAILPGDWRWFGHAGHFICAPWCRFHLTTEVGDFLVSTVGEYCPDAPVREILAESRKVKLTGKGDERLGSFLDKCGFVEIGVDRKYETMVFRLSPDLCDCGCGARVVASWSEKMADGYNERADAQRGHYKMCESVAAGEVGA